MIIQKHPMRRAIEALDHTLSELRGAALWTNSSESLRALQSAYETVTHARVGMSMEINPPQFRPAISGHGYVRVRPGDPEFDWNLVED